VRPVAWTLFLFSRSPPAARRRRAAGVGPFLVSALRGVLPAWRDACRE